MATPCIYRHKDTYLFFGNEHHFVFHLLFPSSTLLCKTTFMTQFSLSFPDFDLNTFSVVSTSTENCKMCFSALIQQTAYTNFEYFLLLLRNTMITYFLLSCLRADLPIIFLELEKKTWSFILFSVLNYSSMCVCASMVCKLKGKLLL